MHIPLTQFQRTSIYPCIVIKYRHAPQQRQRFCLALFIHPTLYRLNYKVISRRPFFQPAVHHKKTDNLILLCGEFECLPSDAVWTNSMAYVMLEKTRPRGRRDDPRQVEVAVDPAGGAGCAGGADGFGDPAGQRPQVRLSPGGPICRGRSEERRVGKECRL